MRTVYVLTIALAIFLGGCATQRTATPAAPVAGKPIIVQPGEGKELHAFGDIMTVLLGGNHTGKTIAVMSNITPPGSGPPLHVHHDEAELFLVIDGRISYFADGQWTEVKPGGAVYLPRNTVHCFRNIGTTPSRHWIIMIPSGFETFFARCAEEFAKPGGPDMNRIVEISREHGIEYPEEGKH